uniref:Serine protease K12H4.7 n=1 Tax=Ditylenchus dipsaci TaxID=166011 RepID=A0A915D7C9_9BILA
MKSVIGIFLAFFIFQISAFTEHPFFTHLASVNREESDLDVLSRVRRSADKATPSKENWFNQTVDHFSDSNVTFQQRYFVNKAFVSGSANINILWIEGAEAANPAHVDNVSYSHVLNAKSLNAAVFALEHRFYGKSQPYQAVEDVAAFIKAQNKASGQQNPKWVLYGAFYGGSLALWTRKKYPTLSVGVVSSSAPQVPAADFYLYQKNVEDAYKNFSQTCYSNIKTVFW